MDEQAVMDLAQRAVGYLMGAAVSTGVHLGDRLGLYREMAGAGPLSADEVAVQAGRNRRLVREWLDGQAAAGLIGYDSQADAYTLSDAAVVVLADDTSPAFLARFGRAAGVPDPGLLD